jgi:hypothetical protein
MLVDPPIEPGGVAVPATKTVVASSEPAPMLVEAPVANLTRGGFEDPGMDFGACRLSDTTLSEDEICQGHEPACSCQDGWLSPRTKFVLKSMPPRQP